MPTPARHPAAAPGWRRVVDLARLLAGGAPDWVKESWSSEMEDASASAAAEFQPDIVHLEFAVMAQYVWAVRAAAPRAVCIVTEHEPGFATASSEGVALRRRFGNAARRRAWLRYAHRTLTQADAVVAFTPRDRDLVEAAIGSATPVKCIPLRLLPARSAAAARPEVRSDLLFVGAFRHPPNTDAALRIVDSIFPRIRMALPTATMVIVGADPPPELVGRAPTGLTFTGQVEDVGPYLAGTSIVVCPLRLGGGMRVKVLEACMHGKALIASSLAVDGLDLVPGEHFVLAESDEEFAEAAQDLLADPTRRSRLADAARNWALETQDPQRWAAEYDSLYSQLLATPLPRDGPAGP